MKKLILTVPAFLLYVAVFAQPESVLLKTADSLTNAKKYDAAVQAYSKLLKQKPQHEKALIGRAVVYVNLNKLTLAEKDYNDAIKANPSCIDCHIGLGRVKIFQNDLAAAQVSAGRVLQLDEKNYQGWLLKARVSLAQKKYSEAATGFNKAISLDSNNADAFYLRSTLFIQMQLFESAIKDLSTVNRLQPDFAVAYYETGVIYANQEKWEDALKYFQLALQKDSTDAGYYKAVGNVYVYKKDAANAIKFYSKAIRLDDKDGEAYLYRANAYHALEDMDAYCKDIKAAVAKFSITNPAQLDKEEIAKGMAEFCDSTLPGYYYQRGIASYNLKQFDKSVQWYTKGLAKYPQHFMLISFRGNAQLALQQFDKAEKDYTQALSLKDKLTEETKNSLNFYDATDEQKKAYVAGSLADVYRHRGEVRLSLNNYTGAMVDIDEAIKIMPAEMEGREAAFNAKGAVYMAQEDNTNALSWLNKAVQANPSYAIALVNRAIVKFNLAYKTRVISSEISLRTAGSTSRLNLPDKTKTVVVRDNIESALADCNKAIAADPTYAYAFYIRGVIKMGLDQQDYCYDILKSEQLGFAAATAVIAELKCR